MQSVKFADNAKFRESVGKLEGRAATQRGRVGVKEGDKNNFMKLNVHMQQYRLVLITKDNESPTFK